MSLRQLWVITLIAACGSVKNETPIDAPIEDDASTPLDGSTECPIGTTALCDGADLVTCDGQGNIVETTTCSLGCDSAETRCAKLNPSNGLAAALDQTAAAADLVLTGNASVDGLPVPA